uniref:Uncharacterized protein n=1 Tax=Rhizophora mucronata TaxID=61149 RepID=A0A2P2IR53_RHIMU
MAAMDANPMPVLPLVGSTSSLGQKNAAKKVNILVNMFHYPKL